MGNTMTNVEELLEATQALPGWMSVEKGRKIIQLVVDSKAERCVELGVFGGRSLICMAFGLQMLGRGTADGIDPYALAAALEGTNTPENDSWWSQLDYESVARAAQKAICRLGLFHRTRLIRMCSREVAEFYSDRSIDCFHLDGNHAEEIASEDVALWAPKIRPGGYFIFDDTNWPTTQRAQRELEALGFEVIEDYGGAWKVYQQ